LSAVFLAHALGARCRLIKDVDGVYESDPADANSHPRRLTQLDYADALRVAGRLIQPKAVAYLRERGGRAEVAASAQAYASTVNGGPTEIYLHAAHTLAPLKVLLLGFGTVGFGVQQRLQANPNHFEVIGVVVRDRRKYQALGVPTELLYTERQHVLGLQPDIVVDALPGLEPSRELVLHFLKKGAHVVSANKALMAEHGAALTALATEHGGSVRYSAAVGGATPMIETVDRAAAIGAVSAITAVLNGTCNFVLDACADGATLAAAIADAKREGFAEDDATEDLSGRDAEHKLRILCRHAFRAEPETMDVCRLDETVALSAQEAVLAGKRLRQIARVSRQVGGIHAQVRFEVVAPDSYFGRVNREWNALEVFDTSGKTHQVTGRGAGRWSTTEAVMADLFDIHRQRHTQQDIER
jgi:homoserine dehydrogenase